VSKKNKMAAAAAAAHGAPGVQQACPLPKVAPIITIAAPKIVLVKKAYQKEAHRIEVTLTTDCKFTGTGSLTSPQSAGIKVFDRVSGGTQLNLPLALTGAELTRRRIVYVEAVSASAAMNDTTLSLSIAGGDKPVINSPATDKLTRVELDLDLCKYKPTPGGADPAPLSDADKIATGRNIHLQDDKRLSAGRCLLIVRQAKPAAYTGNVVLIAQDKRVRAFAYAQEVAKAGEAAAQATPLATANTAIPATGLKLWVEGAKVSDKVLDTGFTVEISDLPRREGDRVKITVVETRIDACQSRTAAGKTPKPIDDGKKMNPGRFVHLQDTGNHHGRARILVQTVKPKTFSGKLEVTSWDVTAKAAANPRLKLYAAELPGGAALANPHPINFPGGFPAKGDAELWAEGGKLSAALRDTELRLKVADAEGWMDWAALTVCEFSALKADIPRTPAVTNRAGNSPVNRHEWKIADPAAAAKDFDEDYATNKPFVLIENSVRTADQINLSVKVKPVGVPVRWDVIRDRRPKPNGDHKDVIGLSGNREAPTLGSNAEGLNNTLIADAVGSFHICPFVDCNGSKELDFMAKDGARIDREPFIMMNLVLVRVQGVSNDSKGDKTQCSPSPAAGQTAANFGGFTTSSSGGGAWTAATSGWHADATVDVIGGGDDGLRGLDHVFGGWIQHIYLNDIRAVYTLPAPPPPPPPPPPAVAPPPPAPPPPRSHQYAFISNLPDNTHYGQYHYIGATESALSAADTGIVIKTAPAIDASHILDVTPFGSEGTGGDSAVGSAGFQGGTTGSHGGGYPAPTARPLGQRWQREMWDAPGIGCRSGHISKGGSLASFRFHLGFRTDLCFWTSTDKKPDPSAAGVANRLYVSVYKCTWVPDFAIKFHPTTGVGTITTARKITVTKAKSASNGRAVPVDGFDLETRAPFALGWYAVDART
jgi:hypothetical protein